MLDVHPPHPAAHTWKDFLIHVGTICVGLLIAVGLEQAVEAIHHHHPAEQIIQALQRESDANEQVNRQDLENLRIFTATLTQNISGLTAASVDHGMVHYVWVKPPTRTGWLPLSNASWLMARDSAAFPQLPAEMVRNRWRVEHTLEQVNDLGDHYFNTRYHLDAMLHRNGEAIMLTPEQRDETLREADDLNGQLRHLYSSMDYFAILNRLARQDEPITMDMVRKNRPENSNALPWQ